jgi:hypothetical protein
MRVGRERAMESHQMIIRFSAQVAILALLVGLTVAPIGLRTPGGRSIVPPVAAQTIDSGQCHGDEVLTFAPPNPTVGQEMIVAVTSATTHRGVYLAASERATAVQETEGQLGRVWLWSLTPQLAGPHQFQFFVDFTILCVQATVSVVPSTLAGPLSVPPGTTGLPLTTSANPGLPPILPLDESLDSNSNNSNDNDDNDNDDNDNDDCDDNGNDSDDNGNDSNSNSGNDNCSDSNGNVATTPTASTPSIDSLLCTDSSTNEVTISGKHFGSPRSEFDGQVLFVKNNSGETSEASAYLSWKDGQVVVLVPNDVETGDYTVYLITTGGSDNDDLPDACRHG